ncbi:jg1554, partial [Pararge aegeria aegeria]
MYLNYFLFFLIFDVVVCEDCVTVDFEDGFNDDFTNSYGMCSGLSTWNVEQYSSVDIKRPHPSAATFITPQPGMSCISSFKFTMTSGGTLEVNVYTQSVSLFDQLTVRVFQSIVGGEDILIGAAVHLSNPVPVWKTMSMTINGNGSFEGYVTLQSFAISDRPIIWIDSFRYIGPSFNKDSCRIYEDDQFTTVTPTTKTTEPSTSPEAPTTTTSLTPNEDCVTVDFENNFEDNFANTYGVCVGQSMWDVQQYSWANIESPHPGSASFIAARSGSSCVSSFTFPMTAGGTLAVNAYMIPFSQVDQLTITVFQSVVGGSDVPIGRVFRNEMSSNFVPGWQKFNISIDGPDRFDAYVTFQALIFSSNPTIWIDSFRYIGPSFDKDSCRIYEDDQFTTVIPTTKTTEPSTSTEAPTTTSLEPPNEDCVTVDFENNFEDNFTNTYGVCVGQSMWDVQQYSWANIESPHPGSASFIAARS